MPITYEAISTVTVGSGGAASIEFTSIPGTYTDLAIKISARSGTVGLWNDMRIEFNSSTANYTLRYLGYSAGTAVSYTQADFGANHIAYVPASTSTSNSFTSVDLYFPNYASSNNKSVSLESVMPNNSSTSYFGMEGGLWSQSAAITSLKFTLSGNFLQYSTATLYGITKS